MRSVKDREGTPVSVGDYVEFKADVEQCGKVIAISDDGNEVTVENENGFPGDYLRYATVTTVPTDRMYKSE